MHCHVANNTVSLLHSHSHTINGLLSNCDKLITLYKFIPIHTRKEINHVIRNQLRKFRNICMTAYMTILLIIIISPYHIRWVITSATCIDSIVQFIDQPVAHEAVLLCILGVKVQCITTSEYSLQYWRNGAPLSLSLCLCLAFSDVFLFTISRTILPYIVPKQCKLGEAASIGLSERREPHLVKLLF